MLYLGRMTVKLPKLPVMVAIGCAIGFVGSALLNIQQYQHAQQEKKLLQGQITDLRYELNLERSAAEPTPTPSVTPDVEAEPSPTPDPAVVADPKPSPAVAGTSSLQIAEFGVKLTAPAALAGLTYKMVPNGTYTVAGLALTGLAAQYPGCAASTTNNVLGQIARKTVNQSSGVLIKKLGSYYYFYIKPNGYCTTDQAGKDALDQARAAVSPGLTGSITL